MSGGDSRARRSIEVGLRRVPELDPMPLPESDPGLVARIADEIRTAGPMTFARFMELALYDPEAGYYTAGETGPGRRGDFLTAPESHPIFGWTLARRLEQLWQALDRPPRFVVREHGAGSGALAAGILDGLRRSGSDLLGAIRYQVLDAGRARLNSLRARLEEEGLTRWLESTDEDPATGVVIANELLDALPVHRVEGTADGGLVELFVDVAPAGGFRWQPARPSTPALARRLATEDVRLEPGQVAEICLALDGWVAAAAASLAAGVLLIIDYGYPAHELYSPSRGGTLRAYHRHRVHDDPFVAIGRQDLTAHVDLTAVERAAGAAGLRLARRTTQAEYLAELGLGEVLHALQSEPGTTLEAYFEARSAVVRMLDPRATGGFAVQELERAPGRFGRGRR